MIDKKSQVVKVDKNIKNNDIFCPSEEVLWENHPRVVMKFNKENKAVCPYCSTRFKK